MIKKLSQATLGDKVDRKCDICGDHLKLHFLDKVNGLAWLACPYFLNGLDEAADEHTSYSVPLSLTGEFKKAKIRIKKADLGFR